MKKMKYSRKRDGIRKKQTLTLLVRIVTANPLPSTIKIYISTPPGIALPTLSKFTLGINISIIFPLLGVTL